MDCDKKKIKNLKSKNIVTETLKACSLESGNASINQLQTSQALVNQLQANNLNVSTINGVNFNCLKDTSVVVPGIITPVQYINGEPQKPDNDGSFNQKVLDELWTLNLLSANVTNLDAAYGRLKNLILSNFYDCTVCPTVSLNNCNCPIPVYAVFTGSISGNLLTVTSVLDTSYTNCPPVVGEIKVGQRVYGQTAQFLNSVIVNQVSGTPGGSGVYTISNEFDQSQDVSEQTILSISDIGIEECAAIPLRIYGVETLSVGPVLPCGSLINAISYNINIANKSLQSRVAAVYVQAGWEDETGTVKIQGLTIDTRQFDPSILSFGEQMNNTVLLPTELVNTIVQFNPLVGPANAVVQLVVYIEDGLEVFLPATSQPRKNLRGVPLQQNPSSNYAVQYQNSATICNPDIHTGTLSPFVVPPVGVNVTVEYIEQGKSTTSNGAYYVANINGVGYYVVTQWNQNQIWLLNPGDPNGLLPGTFVSTNSSLLWYVEIFLGNYTQNFNSNNPPLFTQPPIGQNVTLFAGTFIPQQACVEKGLNSIGKNVLLIEERGDVFNPDNVILGIYKVVDITPTTVPNPNPYALGYYQFTLENLGWGINVPPGNSSSLNSYFIYLLD